MKKTRVVALSLALALSAGLSSAAHAAETPFSDVPGDHWAASSIIRMVEEKVVTGIGSNQFAPDKSVSYAEFITMIVRYFYEDKVEDEIYRIPDPYKDKWYATYVDAAYRIPINYTLDLYGIGPESAINRYDMAHLVHNVLLKQNIDISYRVDTTKISDWDFVPDDRRNDVSACYYTGILTGTDDQGTFNGEGLVTRAQAVVIMERLIDFVSTYTPTPSSSVQVPADAFQITETSQLLSSTGLEEYSEGFYLNSNYVMYGCGGMGIETKTYNTITFTFTAKDRDARIWYHVADINDAYVDPMEIREEVVVKAGESKTFTFDCVNSKGVGLSFERTDARGNFVEGWVTNIYLTK